MISIFDQLFTSLLEIILNFRQTILVMTIFGFSQAAHAPAHENRWIVWNVGQGQWVTQITNQSCRHFDFGGEIHFFKTIEKSFIKLCKDKENFLYLSHADLDHYAYLQMIAQRTKSTCWMQRPQEMPKLQIKIKECQPIQSPRGEKNQSIINDCQSKDRNKCSTIFKRDYFLFPGDSPKSQEKKWIHQLDNREQIKVLVLGHHGSRTSSDRTTLKKLSGLKMTIASARKKKYGHPHRQTVDILKQLALPILRTESWGNIIFL